MKTRTLFEIPGELEIENVAKRMHIQKNSELYGELEELVKKCNQIARPKAMYTTSYVKSVEGDVCMIDDVMIKSRVMANNIKNQQKVYPYLATCGAEIAEYSDTLTDFMHTWWIDGIKESYLSKAMAFLNNAMKQDIDKGKISRMNPGSLPDWPITEQPKLFSMIEGVERIGIELTESMLMLPKKSVSGIAFTSSNDYSNCELCLNETCINRSKAFDKDKYNAFLE